MGAAAACGAVTVTPMPSRSTAAIIEEEEIPVDTALLRQLLRRRLEKIRMSP
jgi:hypothetical protein